MKNKIAYILVYSFMNIPLALADQEQVSPILLSSAEMDQVTAGFSANVDAGAVATSNYLALTKVSVVTLTHANSSGVPGSGLAVAGGQTVAGAAGPGAATATVVNPSTSLAGPTVYSQQLTVGMAGPIGQTNASAVVAVSTPTVNPF